MYTLKYFRIRIIFYTTTTVFVKHCILFLKIMVDAIIYFFISYLRHLFKHLLEKGKQKQRWKSLLHEAEARIKSNKHTDAKTGP